MLNTSCSLGDCTLHPNPPSQQSSFIIQFREDGTGQYCAETELWSTQTSTPSLCCSISKSISPRNPYQSIEGRKNPQKISRLGQRVQIRKRHIRISIFQLSVCFTVICLQAFAHPLLGFCSPSGLSLSFGTMTSCQRTSNMQRTHIRIIIRWCWYMHHTQHWKQWRRI